MFWNENLDEMYAKIVFVNSVFFLHNLDYFNKETHMLLQNNFTTFNS